MSGVHVSTTINGDPVEFVCTADEPLLDERGKTVGFRFRERRAFRSDALLLHRVRASINCAFNWARVSAI